MTKTLPRPMRDGVAIPAACLHALVSKEFLGGLASSLVWRSGFENQCFSLPGIFLRQTGSFSWGVR